MGRVHTASTAPIGKKNSRAVPAAGRAMRQRTHAPWASAAAQTCRPARSPSPLSAGPGPARPPRRRRRAPRRGRRWQAAAAVLRALRVAGRRCICFGGFRAAMGLGIAVRDAVGIAAFADASQRIARSTRTRTWRRSPGPQGPACRLGNAHCVFKVLLLLKQDRDVAEVRV